ncbi:hypothetical protein [Mycetocola manganoxydans]|uniref:hypothetical protein n=1 Tax=Mycetocola manganoxydans TaxID=699879 RepID=UPI00160385F8|nr:hypothetical protein [Mycetocola manganoxydans]GHD41905.1 hypothetical protein GCM10008097_07230 [Mycetocola manganoxydans]
MSNTDNTDPMQGEPGEPGPDSTIPDSDTGIAVGYTGEPSTMEPEEDPDHPSDDKTIES